MQTLSFWKRSPFTRLIFPLILGILLGFYLQLPISIIASAFFIAAIAYLVFYLFRKRLNPWLATGKGVLIHVFLVCIGTAVVWLNAVPNYPSFFGGNISATSKLIVSLNEKPLEKTNSFQAEASVLAILDSGKQLQKTGKIILYFSKDSLINSLDYGDQIIIGGQLQEIKNAGNPGSFNYKQFASFHGWHHTAYLRPGQYVVTGVHKTNWFKQQINSARNYVINTLKQYLSEDKDALSMAEALIIGHKVDLDKDLVQAYSNTGIVHIIAVSGMHLAMIYVLLEYLFNIVPFLKNNRRKAFVIILLLWGFAFVSGGSASVLRSAIMFTCIIICKTYFKKPSSYNGLAVSAFILLCYNPFYLWDVGFQMSYLAVGGIMWLQRPIFNLWYIKNKIGRHIWSVSSVTIAAQLVTFPLSLYYFHQFPVLFLIVNILVLPVSAVALYSGVAILIFSFIPIVAKGIGFILLYSLKLMNAIAQYFNKVSFSLIDSIPATWPGTLLIYIAMFCIAFALINQSKRFLYTGLGSLLLFVVVNSAYKLQYMRQEKIIVYNAARYTAIDVIDQNNYLFFGDPIFKEDAVYRNFHLKPSRILMQANEEATSLPTCAVNKNYIFYKNSTVFIADSSSKFLPLQEKLPVTILVLTKNAPSLEQLCKSLSPKMIVCNGTNSLWKTAKYKQEAEALHLPFHSTASQGAFVYDLKKKSF